ncbi:MAG: sigma-70 family RNA polymerase sigma factor [Bryobacteraceae bacterium]
MEADSAGDVTRLLSAWSAGDQSALEQMIPLVYRELHQRAEGYMAREAFEHTLQTTALVNEVYLRLVDLRQRSWQNRAQFFAVCAKIMRHILVDVARSRKAKRRGGGRRVPLDEALTVCSESPEGMLAIDNALTTLSTFDFRKSRVVELRFFGGLDVEETAAVLKVSQQTVLRDWKVAKVWLVRHMKSGAGRAT